MLKRSSDPWTRSRPSIVRPDGPPGVARVGLARGQARGFQPGRGPGTRDCPTDLCRTSPRQYLAGFAGGCCGSGSVVTGARTASGGGTAVLRGSRHHLRALFQP